MNIYLLEPKDDYQTDQQLKSTVMQHKIKHMSVRRFFFFYGEETSRLQLNDGKTGITDSDMNSCRRHRSAVNPVIL